MPPSETEKSQWVAAVRGALDAAGMSVRGLARLFAGEEATDRDIETQRRKINKWLDVDIPTLPSEPELNRLGELVPHPVGAFSITRSRRDRLEELEAEAAKNTQAIEALRQAVAILLGLVVELGAEAPALPDAALPPTARGIGT